MIDSQSVKTTEAGGPQGYDAGKNVKSRKRHAMVDTNGRVLLLHLHPADVQDRDGATSLLLKASRRRFPLWRTRHRRHSLRREACRRRDQPHHSGRPQDPGPGRFEVHPRRWVVERCFAWLDRNRRLAKDFEATIVSANAFLYAASAMLLIRRLARPT